MSEHHFVAFVVVVAIILGWTLGVYVIKRNRKDSKPSEFHKGPPSNRPSPKARTVNPVPMRTTKKRKRNTGNDGFEDLLDTVCDSDHTFSSPSPTFDCSPSPSPSYDSSDSGGGSCGGSDD